MIINSVIIHYVNSPEVQPFFHAKSIFYNMITKNMQ